MHPQSSTNLKNRVNKLHLPKTKPLLPLFEIISNSIHAINEKQALKGDDFKGEIFIKTIRNGREETLKEVSDIEIYPINSFQVIDNGIGLDSDNIKSFAEFDTERKAKIGGKGVGRLVCLKAFRKIIVESVYFEDEAYKIRKFEYKKSNEGFDKYEDNIETNKKDTGTISTLSIYEEDYIAHVPLSLHEIARQVITHFQLYFIQRIEPQIIIKNQDNIEINLTDIFNEEFEKEILDKEFDVSDSKFTIFISKSFKAKSHKIHYCAHERSVKEEGLSKYIEDLKYIIKTQKNDGYYFQIFVVGDFLNKNVNEERTSFNFTLEEENDELELKEITLSKIRKNAILSIEELLSDFLTNIRKEKLEIYYPIIEKEYPNYHSVINYNKEKVEKLPIGLTKEELDLKLYEIESEWRIKVKKEGIELIDKKKDITTLEEYTVLYEKFLTEFNEVGQSDLARYIIHRRAVIDLLDKLIELNEENKFANEEIVHSLFFPIREHGSAVASDKQNLWLIDERLTFNSLLSSDKLFKQIKSLDSESSDRIDLVVRKEAVFEDATLFSEEKFPFESFTIVEFKKPERNDFKHGDKEKDPVKQVRSYIEQIIKGKEKNKGKTIGASKNTPFYCYIIADVTDTLKDILDYESFSPTPDGLGYFRFYDTSTSRSYIEVLPFKKVIKDAKQRNKILFDKLKLS
ncbi:ATP-binding protein [Cytophaga aurantiaca]|uniref:ATP-binding protein n=1 Tax=Cytophaga aurantiaca TaxID=29530 RepID=UPI00036CD8F9|nr:ATP-binding protein [Cytophaga aurantiaca]